MKPTQEQVIAWAREARLAEHTHPYKLWSASDDGLERFATLAFEAGRESAKLDSIHTCHDQCQRPTCVAVREAYERGRKDENEACAKVCDEKVEAEYATGKVDHNEMGWTQACAIAIRARREQ